MPEFIISWALHIYRICTDLVNLVEATAGGGVGGGAPPTGDASYLILIRYYYNFAIEGYGTFLGRFKTGVRSLKLFAGKGREILLYRHDGKVSSAKRSLPAFLDDGMNRTLGVEEDWYSSDLDVSGTGLLEKRLELDDISAFAKGALDCNDNGQCASGGCNGGACDWSPPKSKKRQESDDEDDDDPMDTDDDNESCIVSMPAMMYNCRYFPDTQTNVPNMQRIIGICSNILEYMAQHGLNTGPFTGRFHSKSNTKRVFWIVLISAKPDLVPVG